MAEGLIQVPPDSTGKRTRTRTQTIGSVEVHSSVVAVQDASGTLISPLTDAQIRATALPVGLVQNPTYQWIVPSTSVGANKVFFDFFNGTGSGKIIRVHGIFPIVDTDVAVTGVLGIRILATRTSTVGTGGTPWVKDGAVDVAGGAWVSMDTSDVDIPSQITGRHLSTAGATDQAWLRGMYVMGEESATSQAYTFQGQVNMFDSCETCKPIMLREGFGIKVRQGAIASVGNVRFRIVFTLV